MPKLLKVARVLAALEHSVDLISLRITETRNVIEDTSVNSLGSPVA